MIPAFIQHQPHVFSFDSFSVLQELTICVFCSALCHLSSRGAAACELNLFCAEDRDEGLSGAGWWKRIKKIGNECRREEGRIQIETFSGFLVQMEGIYSRYTKGSKLGLEGIEYYCNFYNSGSTYHDILNQKLLVNVTTGQQNQKPHYF